jgi:hypothetical protein
MPRMLITQAWLNKCTSVVAAPFKSKTSYSQSVGSLSTKGQPWDSGLTTAAPGSAVAREAPSVAASKPGSRLLAVQLVVEQPSGLLRLLLSPLPDQANGRASVGLGGEAAAAGHGGPTRTAARIAECHHPGALQLSTCHAVGLDATRHTTGNRGNVARLCSNGASGVTALPSPFGHKTFQVH